MIDFTESLGYPHTLDYIGIERIKRAALKIKENAPEDIDLGFKHYTLREVKSETIDKLEKFENSGFITDDNIFNEFGTNTILTTCRMRRTSS